VALDAAENRRQYISYAINDIAFGIGSDSLMQRHPATGLAGKVES
jgi:hypothetical protein